MTCDSSILALAIILRNAGSEELNTTVKDSMLTSKKKPQVFEEKNQVFENRRLRVFCSSCRKRARCLTLNQFSIVLKLTCPNKSDLNITSNLIHSGKKNSKSGNFHLIFLQECASIVTRLLKGFQISLCGWYVDNSVNVGHLSLCFITSTRCT